jgi:hypothetical protein
MNTTLMTRLVVCASLPLLVVSLAGCSGGSKDGDSATSHKQPSKAATAHDWDLAFASCMRDGGLDFPDPVDGESPARPILDGVDQAKQAEIGDGCEKQVGSKLGARPAVALPGLDADDATKKDLEVNECLRKKGYDVSDPGADGGESGAQANSEIPAEAWADCGLKGGPGAVTVAQ